MNVVCSAARHAEPGAEAAFVFLGTPNAPQKRVSVSEGTRADCEAIERTSEAKCPQGAALSPHYAKGCMAMDATPNAILRLRSGERTQPGGP